MAREPLKNKPLVEAILEVRWALQAVKAETHLPLGVIPSAIAPDGQPIVEIDPHFRLLLGRVFDRVKAEYPKHEQLPAAYLPDVAAGQVVQHRLRHPDGWPIIQLGPGILTVNDTAKYIWSDFQPRALGAFSTLHEAHPSVEELQITSLSLRYIDAVDFDCGKEDITAFLDDKMAVQCRLPDGMFNDSEVERAPLNCTWRSTYRCKSPKGRVAIKFATGSRENKPALIWETVFETAGDDLPGLPDGFEEWLEAAHEITDEWFFTLIEGGSGELKRRFSGD